MSNVAEKLAAKNRRREIVGELSEPYAEITHTSRFFYYVKLKHGWTQSGGWFVLGKRWAENLAKRKLRAYIRREEYEKYKGYAIVIRSAEGSFRVN